MKKIKYFLLVTLILPCVFLLSACGAKTTYHSPTVTVNEITVTNIEKVVNRCAMSVVSVYVEGSSASGSIFGAGSGVIYSIDKNAGDAYIVTNYHVLQNDDFLTNGGIASNIWIELYGSEGTYFSDSTGGGSKITYGEQSIPCDFVGGSLEYDLALIKVSGNDLLKQSDARACTFATEQAHLGQTAIAIGNPLAEHLSATSGIVSVESEYIKYSDFHDVVVRCLRTDAPINNGNSGGGLFNAEGELIGIVNAGIDNSQNIGSAIPSVIVKNVCDNILYGYETKSYRDLKKFDVGITVAGVNSHAVFDDKVGLAIIKEDVTIKQLKSPAPSGLKVGDIIKSVQIGSEQLELSRAFEFDDFLLKLRPRSTLKFTVLRSNGLFTFSISV